jgi:hypothetical protein
VKKVALYKGRLAVQLPNRIVIYELADGADTDDDDTGGGGMQVGARTRACRRRRCGCCRCCCRCGAWRLR